jgi:hypothetical protein
VQKLKNRCGTAACGGGVRSQLRTGLGPEFPDNWLFTGYFRELLPVIGKCTGIRCVDSITCKTIP